MANTRDDQFSGYREDIVQNAARNQAISEFLHEQVGSGLWPGIIFVRWSEHARALGGALSSLFGCEVPVITAKVPDAQRDRMAGQMAQRDPALKVVVATDVWSTGIDIPALRWAGLAGEGQAPVGLLQRAGRAVRLEDGKPDFTLFDFRTVGTDDDARYARQAEKRSLHYQRGGYAIRSTPKLEDILRKAKEEPSKRQRERDRRRMQEANPITSYSAEFIKQGSISSGFALFLVIIVVLGNLLGLVCN